MKRHFFTPILVTVLCFFTFQEMRAQTAVCHPTITKETGSTCSATLTFEDIDDGSFGFDTYTISQTEFSGPDTFQVELTVIQNGGQSATCTSTLYVQDKTPPVALVKNDVFIKIDTTNMATITPALVDAGSFDNCSNMVTMTVSPNVVTCQHISPLPVTLTVTDDSGNSIQVIVNVRLSNAANNTQVLACNDHIKVKLNPGESKKMYPYEILEGGPYKCWEAYSLDILENNQPRPDDFVRYEDVNKNLLVRITDNATQVACWGELKVKAVICDVFTACDTKSRCYAAGDCTSGHTTDDDVEWPCDIVLAELPMEVLDNPTPELIAEFTQQDVTEYLPVFYNDNTLCSTEISVDYTDLVFPAPAGKLIYRTWNVLHWPTGVTASYQQALQLGEITPSACDICDVLAWDTPFTDCAGGHSDQDAVEWPANISINGLRISPADLWYENGFNQSNAMPWIKDECKSLVEVKYEDFYQPIAPDSLHVERVWKIQHRRTNQIYTYTQNIITTDIPDHDAKVCVRRRNGNPMNDVTIFPDVTLEQGPCVEFTLQPSHTLLKPEKPDTDYLGGVDLADLMLLYEHVLAIRELDAVQQAAGDLNGTGYVSTLDIVLLTRMLEGKSVDLSYWPSPWKFGYHYLNFNSKTDFANQRILVPGAPQHFGHHFVGYKLGDIDDSYENGSILPIPVQTEDEILTMGEHYSIPVLATSDMKIKGIQAKLKKQDGIQVTSIHSNHFPLNQFTASSDYDSFFSFDKDNFSEKDITTGDVLFTIQFEATKNDVLHNVIQFLEGDHQKIITEDYLSIPFDLHFDGLITVGTKNQTLVNVQIQPNPVNDILTIQHDLEGPVHVTVYSSTGQKMINHEAVTNSTLAVNGLTPSMYFLQVRDQNGKTGYTTFIKN